MSRQSQIKSVRFAHGGAWKVAYADFVTGMMSLFLVLWIYSGTQRARKKISGLFLIGYVIGSSSPLGSKIAKAPAETKAKVLSGL